MLPRVHPQPLQTPIHYIIFYQNFVLCPFWHFVYVFWPKSVSVSCQVFAFYPKFNTSFTHSSIKSKIKSQSWVHFRHFCSEFIQSRILHSVTGIMSIVHCLWVLVDNPWAPVFCSGSFCFLTIYVLSCWLLFKFHIFLKNLLSGFVLVILSPKYLSLWNYISNLKIGGNQWQYNTRFLMQ